MSSFVERAFGIDVYSVIKNFELNNYLQGLPLTSLKTMICFNIFYFVTLWLLKKYMDKREAFNPRKFMIFYNFTCMCLATYCFVGMAWFYYTKHNSLSCQTVDFDSADSHWIAHFIWIYYVQKYWEYIDTFLFVLRKSYRQVTFLHLYHHSSVTMVVRLYLLTYPGGDNCILVLANSLIHMMMYTHYLCSVLKMKCWWRSYLTQLQLVQFIVILAINVIDLVKGNCQTPQWMNWLMIVYMITMLLLFSRFYINRYISAAKPKEQ